MLHLKSRVTQKKTPRTREKKTSKRRSKCSKRRSELKFQLTQSDGDKKPKRAGSKANFSGFSKKKYTSESSQSGKSKSKHAKTGTEDSAKRAKKLEKREQKGTKEKNVKENSRNQANAQIVIRRKMAAPRKKKEANARSSYKKLHLGKNGKKLPPPKNEKNSKLMEEYRKVVGDKQIPPKRNKQRAKKLPEKANKSFLDEKTGALKQEISKERICDHWPKKQIERNAQTGNKTKKQELPETGENVEKFEISEKDSRRSSKRGILNVEYTRESSGKEFDSAMMGTALKINTEKIRLLQAFNDLLFSVESVERKMEISFKKEKQELSNFFNSEIFAQIDAKIGAKVGRVNENFKTFSKKN